MTNVQNQNFSKETVSQEVVESKRCECCGKILPLDQFFTSRKGNLFKICRDCVTAKKVASYKHNRNAKKAGGTRTLYGTIKVHPKGTHSRTQTKRLHRRVKVHECDKVVESSFSRYSIAYKQE